MRAIDGDALLELLEAWKDESQKRGAEINYKFASAMILQVNAMPTIEPEIIRCKDCRWWDKFPTDSAFPDYRKCNAHALARISTKANDFCSRAERRADGNT